MISPKSHIAAMKPYKPPIEGRADIECRLDFNESLDGPIPEVVDELAAFIRGGKLGVYPEYGSIEDDVARFYGLKDGQAILANGSDQSIDVIIRTYAGAGDEVIIPTPSFAMFYQSAMVEGADIREVLYKDDLGFPTEEVLGAIGEKTGLIIICNPNNPTGTPVSQKDIKRIVEAAAGIPVFIDEAYYEFNLESSVDLIAEHENVIISRSFSKAFGLAALRAGCIWSLFSYLENMHTVRGAYDGKIAARAGIAASITHYDKVLAYCEHVMGESKPYLEKGLAKLGLDTYPSSANFIVVRFGDDVGRITEELAGRGILIRDRSGYPLLAGCARVSVGPKDASEKLLSALREIL